MPIVRPPGVECPKWEPVEVGSKRCRYYLAPGAESGSTEGLCKLPDELLCVEWVRRFGTADQKSQLAARGPSSPPPPQPRVVVPDPDAPPPLVLVAPAPAPPRAPARIATAGGELRMAPPRPFEPAKEIDPDSLEALERAGVEVELAAPYIEGGITLVPARTGRTDRSEITFREAATIRLIVDCFPGAHVTAYRPGPAEPHEVEESNGRAGPAGAEPMEGDPLS